MSRHIPMIAVVSRSIAAVGYDADTQTLRVRFVTGGIYDYRDVPAAVFAALMRAESKGRFVNWVIKPNFPVEPVDDAA